MKLKVKIITNKACNLDCRYCYVKQENEFINKSIINKFLNNIRENSDLFYKHCTFFGGEPSLSSNLITSIISENSDFKFNIITNGYLLFCRNDYKFYSLFDKVTFSLEGCEKSYNFFRGEKNLIQKIDKVISFKKNFQKNNIVINISINKFLYDNIDEFSMIYNLIKKNSIDVHFYSIKGEDKFINSDIFYHFLKGVREKNYELYKDILNISNINCKEDIDKVDAEFLCSYNDELTLLPNGDLCCCDFTKDDNGCTKKIGNYLDIDSYKNIFKEIQSNHKSFWTACSTCHVPIGFCEISCPGFIKECYKENNLDFLNKKCEFERIKHYLRIKELS